MGIKYRGFVDLRTNMIYKSKENEIYNMRLASANNFAILNNLDQSKTFSASPPRFEVFTTS